MTTAIVKGSLSHVAERNQASLAESFLSAETIILIDVSISMRLADAGGAIMGPRSRFDVACSELEKLQERNPGKLAVVSFSSDVKFLPGGKPYGVEGGTDLAAGLKFVRVADGTVKFIVISDGEPDSEWAALTEARKFTSQISTIYCGPEGGDGASFLALLASNSGGVHASIKSASSLAETTQRMLPA